MADLGAALRPFVDSGTIPGLVALVARADEVEVVTLGVQGASGTPMACDSIFRAASVTKPMMAALTMMLVEDGRLDLDAPVDDLLPELAAPRVLREPTSALDDTVPGDRPITTRHLLSSTSGHGFTTVDSPVVPLLLERLRQGSMQVGEVPAPDEWMRQLATIPLIHQPGEGWTYNASYDVLGVLLARARGSPSPTWCTSGSSHPWAWSTPPSTSGRQARSLHHPLRPRRRRRPPRERRTRRRVQS